MFPHKAKEDQMDVVLYLSGFFTAVAFGLFGWAWFWRGS